MILSLPDRLTPVTKIVPESSEVEPWVEAVIRLWDDDSLYAEQSALALKEAERWRPERLRPLYAEFFRNVRSQPGAPVRKASARSREGEPPCEPRHHPARSEPRPPRIAHGETGGFDGAHGSASQLPLSVVACVSDDAIARANLLASPGLTGPGSPHEVILIHDCPSAAAGLTMGWMRAKHPWVICVHQDVVLSAGWDRSLAQQLREAERRFGPIGVAGVYGIGEVIVPMDLTQPLAAERIGWVVDRGRVLRDGPDLPARVATLDELILIVRRDALLRFDPALGFHLYGADLCLQAREAGLAVVALELLCQHNSRTVGLPDAFFQSAQVFARKWSHRLPVATPCVIIDKGGVVFVLGNAGERPASVAFAVGSRQ